MLGAGRGGDRRGGPGAGGATGITGPARPCRAGEGNSDEKASLMSEVPPTTRGTQTTRASVVRHRPVLELRPGPLVRLRLLRLLLQLRLVHHDAQSRAGRQPDVAVLVELPLHPRDAGFVEPGV